MVVLSVVQTVRATAVHLAPYLVFRLASEKVLRKASQLVGQSVYTKVVQMVDLSVGQMVGQYRQASSQNMNQKYLNILNQIITKL